MNIKLGKAHKLSRRTYFRGLHISVETDKGELRHWYDPHNGEKGSTKMKYPYGYIRRTKGVDGDHIDVYLGPNEHAKNVYVVHQMKAPNFKKYDEDKCMLGFLTAEAAKVAYQRHFNDKRFFGSMTTMSFEDFEKKVNRSFELKRPHKIAEAPVNPYVQHAYNIGAEAAKHAFEKESAAGRGELLDAMLNQAESTGGAIADYGRKSYDKAKAGAGAALESLGLKKKPQTKEAVAVSLKQLLAGAGLLGAGGIAAAAASGDKGEGDTVSDVALRSAGGSRTSRGLASAGL